MPYRLRPGHSLEQDVKAVATAELAKARRLLAEQPDGPHRAIHEARKCFKRLRALYRLVAYDRQPFRSVENARLRDIARSLSQMRDASAFVETLVALVDTAMNDEERHALDVALASLIERRDRFTDNGGDAGERLSSAVRECDAAIEALDGLKLPHKTVPAAKRLNTGWKRSLTKARVALEACREPHDQEAFHELRKAAQAYWRHLALVKAVWPSAISAKRDLAKQVAFILGQEHDIAMLAALLDREPELVHDDQTLSHLLGLLIRRQQSLREESLKLADRLFADAPKLEARILATLWMSAAKDAN